MTRLGGADLHVHTTHSDGACSPCEVVQAASNLGLDALAITDHDTLSALAIARPEARRLGVELVPGIEMTTEHEGREYHVLGYFVSESQEMVALCDDFRARRDDRIVAMVSRLTTLGWNVDLDAIRRAFPRATIGRRHLADWLVRSGQASDHRSVFAEILGDHGPAHVPKPRTPMPEAIAAIRRSGGVAALAHPPYDLSEIMLATFVGLGLRAIEVLGPGVPKSRQVRLRSWADRFDLVPVAGSDFHANDRPGRWLGSITTPAGDLERLRRAIP
jgi:hypothetical protein